MKFQVIAKLNKVPPVSPEQLIKLVVEDFEALKKYQENGKVEHAYALSGLKGFTCVINAESSAELNQLLAKLPLFIFLDIEIYPLMTLDETLSQL